MSERRAERPTGLRHSGQHLAFAGKDANPRIVFANPASLKREKMTIRLSSDNAQTWPIAKELYAGPFGYSSLVAFPDGHVGCYYEKDGYKQLVFVSFGMDWLEWK